MAICLVFHQVIFTSSDLFGSYFKWCSWIYSFTYTNCNRLLNLARYPKRAAIELVDHGESIGNWIQAALRELTSFYTVALFLYCTSVIWICRQLFFLSFVSQYSSNIDLSVWFNISMFVLTFYYIILYYSLLWLGSYQNH